MTDKKNIVIKVKYPTAGAAEGGVAGKTITVWNVKRIMLAVFVLMALLGVMVYFLAGDDDGQVDAAYAKPVVSPEKMAVPKAIVNVDGMGFQSGALVDAKATETALHLPGKPKSVAGVDAAPIKSNKKTPINSANHKRVVGKSSFPVNKTVSFKPNKNVSRALLVYGVNDREPIQAITGPISATKAKPVAVYYFTELKAMDGKKVYHQWLQNGKSIARYELPVSADRWRTYTHRVLAGKARGVWLVRLTDEKGQVLNEKTFTAN